MNFSQFTLYIMLIFLPGIIAYKVFEELTHQKDKKAYEVVVFSFLFGFLSYLLYYFGFAIPLSYIGFEFQFHFFDTLKEPAMIDYSEVFYVSCVAILVGFIITAIDTYKLLFRFSRWLRITKKHGELDTFTKLMNADIGNESWAIIRDIEDNRAYSGWIAEYSVGDEKNELFIRDVIVYENSSGTMIMASPGIYLAKSKEKYIIEFPQLKYTAKMEKSILEKVEIQWGLKTKENL